MLAERFEQVKIKKSERKGSGDSHSIYPLSGKLFCPKCGAMLRRKYTNRGNQEYWVCSMRLKRPKEGCRGIWVPAEATEGLQIEGKAVVMEVGSAITERQAKQEKIGRFVSCLEQMDGPLTEFNKDDWYSLVDYATVYGKDDIRFTFKNGMEIKV